MRPPYGSTFFGCPTGRNCDGRLAIDFIAESLGLPLVPPFLLEPRTGARTGTTTAPSSSAFRRGANFAVGGATALDASFFHRWDPPGGNTFPLNTSLGVQMQWFESLKPSLCGATTDDCKALFGRSLFFVGAFGANDYLLAMAANKTIDEVRSFVPAVVTTISTAVERLITEPSSRGAMLLRFNTLQKRDAAVEYSPYLFVFEGDHVKLERAEYSPNRFTAELPWVAAVAAKDLPPEQQEEIPGAIS